MSNYFSELLYVDTQTSLLEQLDIYLKPYDAVLVVTDSEFLPILKERYPELYVFFNKVGLFAPAGQEALKTIDSYLGLVAHMHSHKLGRKSALVALGGGCVSDLCGFAASTYQRGIAYYNVPTTLLSQVDASIGGKTGINLPLGKNILGSFCFPKAIFNYFGFLDSLSSLGFASGMAEVIKYALLSGPSFFEALYAIPVPLHPNNPALQKIFKECVSFKQDIVEQDPFEHKGLRIFLNLGHTFAHALEAATHYKEYTHGQAVAIGLYLSTLYSHKMGHIEASCVEQLKELLLKCHLPLKLKHPLPCSVLIEFMKQDKKQEASEGLKLILLKKYGQPFVYTLDDFSLLQEVWLDAGAY